MILYRPVGLKELELIAQSGFKAFPTRLPEQQERAWPTNAEEAIAIQQELRKQVITTDDLGTVKYVAGVDAAHIESDSITRAAVALLSGKKLYEISRSFNFKGRLSKKNRAVETTTYQEC